MTPAGNDQQLAVSVSVSDSMLINLTVKVRHHQGKSAHCSIHRNFSTQKVTEPV